MWFGLTFVVLCGVTLTEDRRLLIAKVIRRALDAASGKLEAAAIEAERDVRQLAREIEGQTGAIRALMMQPDEFWRELGVEIAATFGLPRRVRVAQRLRAASVERRRMARMEPAVAVVERVS